MSKPIPRCQVVPLADHQAAFTVDGALRLRWHFGPAYPRPFFYPLVGPSGAVLTRMGHPGAPDHDIIAQSGLRMRRCWALTSGLTTQRHE